LNVFLLVSLSVIMEKSCYTIEKNLYQSQQSLHI
jgi:hypothetical protein